MNSTQEGTRCRHSKLDTRSPIQAERRLVLRLEIELPLKLPDTVRCCQAHRQSPILGFVASAPEVRVLPSADITRHRRYYDPVRLPPASPSETASRARPSCLGGSPQLPASPFRRAVPITPVDRSGCICRLLPRRVQPSPKFRRVGVHDFSFEACSGFTRVTARRIAQPPKAAFVTRLRPAWSPRQAARQLPDQPTTLWVEPSSTGDARHLGALNFPG